MAKVEIIAANLKTNIENSVKKVLKRVCAYCRVSTDSEEQQTSYNSQITYYTDKIKSNPEWKFAGIYADEGISGTQVNKRTEFMRMIDDAINGKIDMIIAKSISRFARNTLDTLKYVRLLRDHNVDVYFEKENIHTLDLDSEMFLTLYSAFAQAESESISQNVKMGIKAKMKRGEYVGLPNPYGYDWNKVTQELTINEEQAEVVRMIFNWYADGIGCNTIAKKINEKGIPSPRGKKWSQQYVREMLDQEKYVGDLIGQKLYTVSPITHKKRRNYGEKERYYSKDKHEAIISRELWEKVHEILKKRNAKLWLDGKEHTDKYSKRYAFSSKIICGFCGTSYTRRKGDKKKNGECNVYWTCNERLRDNHCKDAIFIREEALENLFVQVYNSIIDNKHKTKEKLFQAIKSVIEEDNTQVKLDKLKKEEDSIRQKISKLIDLKLEDYINKEAYIEKEKELQNQLNDILSKKEEYENIEHENKNMMKRLKEIEKILDEPLKLKEFDREVFDNIIDKIIIGEIEEDGTHNNKIIRFILKTGKEFKKDINKNNGNNIVSLIQEKSESIVSNYLDVIVYFIYFN